MPVQVAQNSLRARPRPQTLNFTGCRMGVKKGAASVSPKNAYTAGKRRGMRGFNGYDARGHRIGRRRHGDRGPVRFCGRMFGRNSKRGLQQPIEFGTEHRQRARQEHKT